jgi:hypothetical protein
MTPSPPRSYYTTESAEGKSLKWPAPEMGRALAVCVGPALAGHHFPNSHLAIDSR